MDPRGNGSAPGDQFSLVDQGVEILDGAADETRSLRDLAARDRALGLVAIAWSGSSGSVWVVDTTNNTVVATITVGESPFGVAADPQTHTAQITDIRDDAVAMIGID